MRILERVEIEAREIVGIERDQREVDVVQGVRVVCCVDLAREVVERGQRQPVERLELLARHLVGRREVVETPSR